MLVLGIDPGARYTGTSVQDTATDTLLWSGTYVRPDDYPIFAWGLHVGQLIQDEIVTVYPDARIGIEGISDPKGFKGGQKATLNPKHIIRTGIVAGALAGRFHQAVIVPPKKNGHSRAGYPDSLVGRRPKDLPGPSVGVGTRDHERSAYDVAREIEFLLGQGYILDEPNM